MTLWKRTPIKCTGTHCNDDAVFHFTWAEDRKGLKTEHFCDRHAHCALDHYRTQRSASTMPATSAKGFTRLEIDLVIASDEHLEQVIYLREAEGLCIAPILTGSYEAAALSRN
jgi:hypothetical protein